MPARLTQEQLTSLARLGARVRLEELRREIAQLQTLLDRDGSKTRSAPPRSTRRKPRWSASARKAVSERMKNFWANRRRQGARSAA